MQRASAAGKLPNTETKHSVELSYMVDLRSGDAIPSTYSTRAGHRQGRIAFEDWLLRQVCDPYRDTQAHIRADWDALKVKAQRLIEKS